MGTRIVTVEADRDSYMQNPGTSLQNGGMDVFNWGMNSAGTKFRCVLRFTLPSLNTGETLASATLTLGAKLVFGSTAAAAHLYRCTQYSWQELTSSWNNYDTSLPWAIPGGDYVTTDGVSLTLPLSTGFFVVSGLKTLTQDAYDNRGGVLLLIGKRDNESFLEHYITFFSRETGTPTNRPFLTLTINTPQTTTVGTRWLRRGILSRVRRWAGTRLLHHWLLPERALSWA